MRKKRSGKEYSSHLPVLRYLATLLKPKVVIEFGVGFYSTSLFLNRTVYNDLTKLCSYETKKRWFMLYKSEFRDERFNLELIPSDEELLKIQDFPKADLVFVDGLKKHRNFIIKNLSHLSNTFVLHDGPRRNMTRKYLLRKTCNFKNIHVFVPKGDLPTTVIFSNVDYKFKFRIVGGKCFRRKND